MKLVYIKWLDSSSHGDSWMDPNDLEDDNIFCESVGWLQIDGKKAKVIVPHKMNCHDSECKLTHSVFGALTIPNVCIVEIRELIYESSGK